MNRLDQATFLKTLILTAEIYNKEFSEEHAILFYEHLRDYETEDVSESFYEHRAKSEYFPTPAAIIKNIEAKKNIRKIKYLN